MELDFTKGIHTRTTSLDTPKGYYKDAMNMRISGRSKRTEEGTLIIAGVPEDIKVWGSCAISSSTIVIGESNTGTIIGELTVEDVWITHAVLTNLSDPFQVTGPTQVEGKKNWAGERVVYFLTNTGSWRVNLDTVDWGSSSLPEDVGMFLNYELPTTGLSKVSENGELPSGIYQFAVRLVSEGGSKTVFGVQSNMIPITLSSLTSGKHVIQGGPPQTPTTKAIELLIEDVNPAFKYLEIAMFTYIGLENAPVVKVTDKILINGRTSISYTFRGAPDTVGTIPLVEYITSGVQYKTGKYLAQKDGSLLLGSPEEEIQPDIDWYRVAAGLTLKYTVKEIPVKDKMDIDQYMDWDDIVEDKSNPENDDSYSNPDTQYDSKTYRRNEVYSLTMTPLFTNGTTGPTIHIPAKGSVAVEANTTTKVLGTYISQAKYISNDYPGISEMDGLRLHKFPSAEQEPVVSGSSVDGTSKIRVLGISITGFSLLASELELKSKISGVIFGRVDRKGNETQLAQGILRPTAKVVRRYGGGAWNTEYERTTSIGDGCISWLQDVVPSDGYDHYSGVADRDYSEFQFIAPDIIHGDISYNKATHIYQHSSFWTLNSGSTYSQPSHWKTSGRKNMIVRDAGGPSTNPIITTPVPLLGEKVNIRPTGVYNRSHAGGGKRNTTAVSSWGHLKFAATNGFIWMKTQGDVQVPYDDIERVRDTFKRTQLTRESADKSGDEKFEELAGLSGLSIHSLTRTDPKQYGELHQQISMFVDYFDVDELIGGSPVMFNGDTFITKYGLTTYDAAYYGYGTSGDNFPHKYMWPPNVAALMNFWVESSNNYALRHYIRPGAYTEDSVSEANGSMPFYPAYKTIASNIEPAGLLSMQADNWVLPGYASQYNNQYSAQQVFKPFPIIPKEDTDKKAALTNRIAYSATSVQGEKIDAYQIFQVNDYYDVPQEFGDLTDIYVNRELFASTAQVQWQLFFNTLATHVTSVGEVVLGTGGAFNRPAVPMQTVDGGYGGNTHWTHAVNTIYGRTFVDKRQGKIFLLTKGLEDISGDLDDTKRLDIQKLSDPSILIGSEPLRERVYITLGEETYTYNLGAKAFISRHSYKGEWYFSHGSFLYSNKRTAANSTHATGIFKHGVGEAGKFYGELHESSITLVAVPDRVHSFQFDNLDLIVNMENNQGLNIPFSTFTGLEVFNLERNSGVVDIIGRTHAFQAVGPLEVLASKVKDSFRLSMPLDIVVDPNVDIFDITNHAQQKGDTVRTKWLPSMKGNYVEVKLITDNVKGFLTLSGVSVGIKQNIR